MIDVAHDRDHRGTGPERFGRIHVFRLLVHRTDVLLLAHRLEAELLQQQLDLVEVQSLVHGDHQAEVLERRTHDLRRRDVHELAQLGDRQELGNPDRAGLPLGVLSLLLGLLFPFLLDGGLLGPALLALLLAALELGHDALDVFLNGALVHTLLLFPLLALTLLAATVRRVALGLDAHPTPRAGARRRGRRGCPPTLGGGGIQHPARSAGNSFARGTRRRGRSLRRLGRLRGGRRLRFGHRRLLGYRFRLRLGLDLGLLFHRGCCFGLRGFRLGLLLLDHFGHRFGRRFQSRLLCLFGHDLLGLSFLRYGLHIRLVGFGFRLDLRLRFRFGFRKVGLTATPATAGGGLSFLQRGL